MLNSLAQALSTFQRKQSRLFDKRFMVGGVGILGESLYQTSILLEKWRPFEIM